VGFIIAATIPDANRPYTSSRGVQPQNPHNERKRLIASIEFGQLENFAAQSPSGFFGHVNWIAFGIADLKIACALADCFNLAD